MFKSPLYFMYYVFILILFLLDQGSKFAVRQNFEYGESVPVVGKVFHITYVQNTGASFGIFAEYTNVLTYFTLIILIGIAGYVIYLRRSKKIADSKAEKLMSPALALILAGGFGNAADRLIFGFVTDMFDFRIWPVFNVADIYICVGCVMLLVGILKSDFKGKNDAK